MIKKRTAQWASMAGTMSLGSGMRSARAQTHDDLAAVTDMNNARLPTSNGESRKAHPQRAAHVVGFSLAIVWLFLISIADAMPPENITPNPALHAWFESLKQPGTQKPCCSISDCRFTDYKEQNGHFEVFIDGWPYVVPDQAVLRLTGNPNTKAVVCYTYGSFDLPTSPGEAHTAPQDTMEILCFIPVKSVS